VALRLTPYLLLSVLAPLVIGCAGPAVSPTDKSLIAEADQLHTRLAPAVVDDRDPRLKRYFAQLANRITTAAKELDRQGTIKSPAEGDKTWMFGKDVEFHLVNSELPNAFASGGRHVYVYDGLFQRCANEDELAAVFCHAYAHLYARHVQQSSRRDPSLPPDRALLFPFATLQLTPPQERAADTIAFNIFTRAGWDPTRFASLYEQLYNGTTAGVDRNVLREKALDANTRLLPAVPAAARDWAQPPVADDTRFNQLQDETKAVVAATPHGGQPQLLLAAFPNCLSPNPTPAQARARQTLFPPPPVPPPTGDNQWGKGVQGGR
jgi:predicted Zn-dependent protease